MPSILALILCAVFVLFLLMLERRHAPEVSFIMWIPTIWMLSIASKPLGIWFASIPDIDGGSTLDRLFQSGSLLLGLAMLAWHKSARTNIIKDSLILILLVVYMLFSVLWSDDQYLSFKRWVREMPVVIMAFLVLTEQSQRAALESIFRRLIYVLIPFSVLLIKYFPQYGVEFGRWSGSEMWIGVTTQKNGLGRLCLFAAFFLVWSLVTRWQKHAILVSKYQTCADLVLLIMTIILLKGPPGAYSATAIASLSVGLAIYFGLLWMKKCQRIIGVNALTAIMTLVIGFGIVTFFVGGSTIGGFTSTLGREETLTGRTEVWASLVPVAMQKPILGSGFGSFWTYSTREKYDISEAHSGYLDVFLELGFFGLLLISLFLLSSCRKAQRLLVNDFDWGALWICFLFMIIIHNISESSINGLSSQLTTILVFLSVASPIYHDLPQRDMLYDV